MRLSRGLAALTFWLTLLPSLHAEFLYKDDVVNNPNFTQQIEAIGAELKAKTGVSLYMVMVRDLDNNESISDFEQRISSQINEPAVIMTFVELQKQIDILARPTSLYKDFNKAQVLSPNATFIGALVSSVMFARSYDEARELIVNRGGTVLPILAEKTKGGDTVKKYSVAMYNGYTDVAEQIAAAHGQTLSTSAGSGSKNFIDILRVIFYGTILYGIYLYIKRRRALKKEAQNG
ncbi:MAG TPA: 3-dehydroquinate dehydratase [Sulfuricurvum sp.]|nr:3-dehydroquinate dehydratase [Sulfuricurvum sp.]